jgi:hypothetical protein
MKITFGQTINAFLLSLIILFTHTTLTFATGWTATPNTNSASTGLASAKLSSGKVYITGGEGATPSPNYFPRLEEYNPLTNTWSTKANMLQKRYLHTAHAVTISGGGERVLVIGGRGGWSGWPGGYLKSAELYNPSTNSWSYTSTDMASYHYSHTSTLLNDGKVLVVGGLGNFGVMTNAVDLYDPLADTWTAKATMSAARGSHTATLLNDGRVFVIGGVIPSGGSTVITATTAFYDPSTDSWTSGPSLNTARGGHKTVILDNGSVMVTGGTITGGTLLTSVEVWSPSSPTVWTTINSMNYRRSAHTATLLTDGRVLVAGGTGGLVGGSTGALFSAELFDPFTGLWATTSAMPTPHNRAVANLLDSGDVLIINGSTDTAATKAAEFFTP